MPTVPENAPSSTTATNGVDCEPDDDWKENLRKRIEEGLQSMVEDAKENHARELRKAPDTTEARIRLEDDFKDVMQTIKSLAFEQFKLEQDRECNQRRWTAGVPMTPGWSQYFYQEQQNIMNCIKQSNQTERVDDDGSNESDIEENDYGRVHDTVEQVKPWISTTTTITTDRSHLRRNSRQSSVDADLGSSSLRSDDRHRQIDGPGKPPPYYEYRDLSSGSPRDSYAPHRDHQVPQDPRPIPTTRSSYGGDDRDYEGAKRKAEEAAKRREEDSRQREESILEGFRREQEEKRQLKCCQLRRFNISTL
jgi:hypothetical protein